MKMVIKRKSKETLWKEKMETLEEVLEEINIQPVVTGMLKIKKYNKLGTCLTKGPFYTKWYSNDTIDIIAWLEYEEKTQSLVFNLTDEKHLALLKEICKVYERKTLKDEPIIEY